MAKVTDIKARLVAAARKQGTVVEIGDGVRILATSPSIRHSLALAEAQKSDDKDRTEQVIVETFIDVACDPETGDKIFTADDREDVLGLPSDVLNKVLVAAGLKPDPQAVAKN
jgi:hypothetical protein